MALHPLQPNNFKKATLATIALIMMVALDAAIKQAALSMEYGVPVQVVSWFYLLPVLNKNSETIILGINLTLTAPFFLIGFYAYTLLTTFKLPAVAEPVFTIGLAGTIGNLIDRLYYGKVVDYLYIQFDNFFTSIFNLADIFLVVAASWAIVRVAYDLYRRLLGRNQPPF